MTTTTAAVESIRYAIQAGNVSAEPVTRSALDRLAQQTAKALAAAFPGAEVECPIERTSGVRPAGYTRVVMADHEADDSDVRETIDMVSGQAWEAWCQTLTDADLEAL
jgi:trans-2-enoyl-CoA reductase